MGRKAKYSDEEFVAAIESSTSMSEAMRKLGIRIAGGSHYHFSNRAKRMGLDTSHFVNSTSGRVMSSRRRTADDILKLRDPGVKRVHAHLLRRALVEIGRPYKCEGCGQGPEWNGSPLVLEIDHVDGNSWDDRAENLRFLCPNCHSQCETNRPHKNAATVP